MNIDLSKYDTETLLYAVGFVPLTSRSITVSTLVDSSNLIDGFDPEDVLAMVAKAMESRRALYVRAYPHNEARYDYRLGVVKSALLELLMSRGNNGQDPGTNSVQQTADPTTEPAPDTEADDDVSYPRLVRGSGRVPSADVRSVGSEAKRRQDEFRSQCAAKNVRPPSDVQPGDESGGTERAAEQATNQRSGQSVVDGSGDEPEGS